VRPDDDFNILIERHEETQKTLNGKLMEFAAQHFGNVGLADSEESGRLNLFQAGTGRRRPAPWALCCRGLETLRVI